MMISYAHVPRDKVAALKAISAKPDNFYAGYQRPFMDPDGNEYWVDTRYDEDLERAGLIADR